MTNELIHEVEAALKREELEKFWAEYRNYIVGGILLAIVLTGALSAWRAHKHNVNTRDTALLITAMSADEDKVAGALDEAAAQLGPRHRALAFLAEGGALMQADKKKEALAVYQKAAADDSLPGDWHDLATLLAVRTDWALNDAKGRDAEALLSRLKPLLKDEKSPWHYHARLQAGLIAAHGLDDYTQAQEHMQAVADTETAPPSLRERAKGLNHVYTLRMGAAKKAEKPGTEKSNPEG
ncbi:MAG TPA: hypothetical protein VIG74_03230 [Alphaproteobacteria bacterium]|jgi:hypothetical protein